MGSSSTSHPAARGVVMLLLLLLFFAQSEGVVYSCVRAGWPNTPCPRIS